MITAWGKLNMLGLVSCLLIILGFAFTVCLIWPYLDPAAEWTPYLLSAISQSMAAILALVFTVSLIVGQLYSRYFYRMLTRLFDLVTVAYMALFTAAVFLPFWFLSHKSLIGTKVSVTLAAVCLLLLIPYFLRFRNYLNLEQMLTTASKHIDKKIQKGAISQPVELIVIHNAAMIALEEKDYDTFGQAIGHMIDVCRKAYSEAKPILAKEVTGRLHEIGAVEVETPRVPETVMWAFNDLVEWGISVGNAMIMQDVTLELCNYLRILIKNQVEDMAVYGIGILKRIGDTIMSGKIPMDESDSWLAQNVSRGVGDLVRQAIETGLWVVSIEGVEALGNLGNDAIRKSLHQTVGSSEYELRSILFLAGTEEAARGTERSVYNAETSIVGPGIPVLYWELTVKDRQELGWKTTSDLAMLGNSSARECQTTGKNQRLDGIVSLVAESLGAIATTSIKYSQEHAAYVWTASLGDLAYAASWSNLDSLWTISNCLDRIGNALKKNKIEDVVQKTLCGVMAIGASAVAFGNNAMRDHAIGIIHSIGGLSNSRVLSTALGEVQGHLSYNSKLITALEEFWKLLDADS